MKNLVNCHSWKISQKIIHIFAFKNAFEYHSMSLNMKASRISPSCIVIIIFPQKNTSSVNQNPWVKKVFQRASDFILYTVEPRYNEVLGTTKITLLYQVSHYIRVKKLRNIKSWDQQKYLVIRGYCISNLFITRFHCTWLEFDPTRYA